MEISINGKILIPLTETKTEKLRKTETKKFEMETDKFGYICFCFHCISVSRHLTWCGSTNSLWSKSLQ